MARKLDVIATSVGTYGGRPREVGEQFTLAREEDKGRWMEWASDDVSVPRVREKIGTPARAETGPNAAIAAEYASAGHSTTSLLLQLRDAETRAAAAEARAAEFEAKYTAAVAGRAQSDERATRRAFDVSKEEAEKNAAAAAGARKEAVDRLNEAVKTAEEGLADPHRSEQPALQDEQAKERVEAAEAAEEANAEREEADRIRRAEAAADGATAPVVTTDGDDDDAPKRTRRTRRS